MLLAAGPASSAVITFDEFPADDNSGAMPAGRYAILGVTFVAADEGATWGGITNGNPGNWELEGTNGPIFSGFNGGSYSIQMLFVGDIAGFALDVSRSSGSATGDTFTLEGYNNGALVESIAGLALGPINNWATVSLTQVVDEVRWFGSGQGFHPFGIDNVQWRDAGRVPEPGILGLLGFAGLLAGWFGRRRGTP